MVIIFLNLIVIEALVVIIVVRILHRLGLCVTSKILSIVFIHPCVTLSKCVMHVVVCALLVRRLPLRLGKNLVSSKTQNFFLQFLILARN